MTREEQVKLCRICSNQKPDRRQGVICTLPPLPGDFKGPCNSFSMDPTLMELDESECIARQGLLYPASQSKRFANYVLDLIFYLLFSVFFGSLLVQIGVSIGPSTHSIIEGDNILIDYILSFIVGMIYYSSFEYAHGRTIAKYLTKTKVVNEQGGKPTLQSILIRSLCRFIPFEVLSFLNPNESGWHDKFSKTRVIEI